MVPYFNSSFLSVGKCRDMLICTYGNKIYLQFSLTSYILYLYQNSIFEYT